MSKLRGSSPQLVNVSFATLFLPFASLVGGSTQETQCRAKLTSSLPQVCCRQGDHWACWATCFTWASLKSQVLTWP